MRLYIHKSWQYYLFDHSRSKVMQIALDLGQPSKGRPKKIFNTINTDMKSIYKSICCFSYNYNVMYIRICTYTHHMYVHKKSKSRHAHMHVIMFYYYYYVCVYLHIWSFVSLYHCFSEEVWHKYSFSQAA